MVALRALADVDRYLDETTAPEARDIDQRRARCVERTLAVQVVVAEITEITAELVAELEALRAADLPPAGSSPA